MISGQEYTEPIKIGKYGLDYKKHEYVVSRGRLYRCLYTLPDGYVYMRFNDDGTFTKVITGYKIFNEGVLACQRK